MSFTFSGSMKKKRSSSIPSLTMADFPPASASAMIRTTRRFALRPALSQSDVSATVPVTATAAAQPPNAHQSAVRPAIHRLHTHHAITSAGIIPTASHTPSAGNASERNTRRASTSSNAE